ncbi:hypothetical protein WFC_00049 [Escherichia phage vB_EcoM_WFC]|uniref:Uncharacterized protein n=1 Tax=Escherichia phage vB_EcoM_WFC TaxID=2508193 RepID=A0A482MTQ3_9CAUD|nr:hypothetical protein HOV52_gp049 [Escherichia phage vB_EcoM_WFC]QBQ77441.1 hypothetical protein WFC_00049 [Escherichia phage vB_EcoM_WFC]
MSTTGRLDRRDNFEGADNIGGNFFGAGGKVVKNIEEARILLKLRYLTLTSDGRIESINRMLKWIFNRGEAWDYSSSRYAYVDRQHSRRSIFI